MKLEIGMSFEVMESLIKECDVTKGRNYCVREEDERIYDDVNEWFYILRIKRKPIGRLIIKDVK